MTIEQIQTNFNKLEHSISFHIQNLELRTTLIDFVQTNQSRLKSSPASTMTSRHHAESGGLLQHINEVIGLSCDLIQYMASFVHRADVLQGLEDVVVASILHDIHKIGDPFGRTYYEPNMVKASKRKDETQMVQSTAKPYAVTENTYKCSHAQLVSPILIATAALVDRNLEQLPEGDLSLLFVQATSPKLWSLLNDTVKFTIRHHDGAYGTSKYELAGKETAVMLAVHTADMISSRSSRLFVTPAEVAED
jgi:hypothetical protein